MFALGIAGMLVAAASVRADDASARNEDRANSPIKSLAATCSGCHGGNGVGAPDTSIPPIAGLSPQLFLERMRAFRDGEGSPTVMQQIAAAYDAEQTRALATYFATITKR